MLPFVSVVTPTRNRRRFVPMLLRLFRAQTWAADRLELVVADDGDDPVGDLVADDPRVQYVRSRRRLTIGAKRNLCASVARGEILVHMDDDDWYPADRVASCVTALADTELVGKSELWVYHVASARILLYPAVSEGHACAGPLAYRRSYWERRHFPDVMTGEEPYFLDEYRAPLRQLPEPAERVALCIAHGENRIGKRIDLPTAPLPLPLVIEDASVRSFYEALPRSV